VPARGRQTFPLVPRHALTGLPFGNLRSHRRGPGSEVIGSRPYRPGDPISAIDWGATARLSAATGRDEFVVRERLADDAPRVALVLDRRPAMSLYAPPFPWLSKPTVVREAVAAVVASALAARADLASLDFADGAAHWLPPGRRDRGDLIQGRLTAQTAAPEDSLERSLSFLARHRADLPGGSFVFVFSDFLVPPSPETWLQAGAYGWDVVPVVIQDPVWEQSFPDVHGAALQITDPATGATSLVRLSRREAAARRAEHVARRQQLDEDLTSCGLRAVALSTGDPYEIDRAFVQWAEERRRGGSTR
jgi:uncharacterized protein (DUF58 family)